jgi:hypothetical protein
VAAAAGRLEAMVMCEPVDVVSRWLQDSEPLPVDVA